MWHELKKSHDSFEGWGIGNGFREERQLEGGQDFDRQGVGETPLLEVTLAKASVGDVSSLCEADLTLTDLEARKTCWWGTLQVSTAQLRRYMSPMSLRTLKAGRHGEKKAPILKPQWEAS